MTKQSRVCPKCKFDPTPTEFRGTWLKPCGVVTELCGHELECFKADITRALDQDCPMAGWQDGYLAARRDRMKEDPA